MAARRGRGDGFADIAGATGTSYTPTVDDLGFPLRVVVTATNAFGSATVTTAATGNVATDLPHNVGAPGIAGTAKRTLTLTASAGTWTPAGATFAYQWQRDEGDGFEDITNATAAVLRPRDRRRRRDDPRRGHRHQRRRLHDGRLRTDHDGASPPRPATASRPASPAARASATR